jgi:hypothetical protein
LTQAFARVPVQEKENETFSRLRHVVGYLEGTRLDVLKQLLLLGVEVGRHSYQHFVD